LPWTPADWRSGRDAQLERAVRIALDEMKKEEAKKVRPGRARALRPVGSTRPIRGY